jgi:hypothetical protein
MFSFIFTATQLTGSIGGIGWLAEKMAKYAKWAYNKAKGIYALRKLKTGSKETPEPETLTETGAGEEDSGNEGDPAPERPPIINHEGATALLIAMGLSKAELGYMGQAGSKMAKAA